MNLGSQDSFKPAGNIYTSDDNDDSDDQDFEIQSHRRTRASGRRKGALSDDGDSPKRLGRKKGGKKKADTDSNFGSLASDNNSEQPKKKRQPKADKPEKPKKQRAPKPEGNIMTIKARNKMVGEIENQDIYHFDEYLVKKDEEDFRGQDIQMEVHKGGNNKFLEKFAKARREQERNKTVEEDMQEMGLV